MMTWFIPLAITLYFVYGFMTRKPYKNTRANVYYSKQTIGTLNRLLQKQDFDIYNLTSAIHALLIILFSILSWFLWWVL